jgi:CheY-like chemotaxis protein
LQNEDIEMPNSGDTVLVVEDDALIRWNIVDALEDAGFDVLEASNVVEAVAILGAVPDIRAVFTDVDMPSPKDGLDLAHVVSTDRPDVKSSSPPDAIVLRIPTSPQKAVSSPNPIAVRTSSPA